MPRDGSNVYHIPPGTEGIPDTTIESDKYNRFAHDVETDLNTPRPIVAGGTGASSADAGLAALGGETALQIVTNYDSEIFKPGSFYSHGGATSEPVAGHDFAGNVALNDLGATVVVAVDLTDTAHISYTRVKAGGTWGPWTTTNLAAFVSKAGDTMTGPLILSGDPTDPHGATTKQYVDIRNVVAAADPPAGAVDGTLWYETDTGCLYYRYNDGDSVQWVIVPPQADFRSYAFIDSPTFTGDPKAPTPATADNDTSIATTAFVQAAIAANAPNLSVYAPKASPVFTGDPQAPTPSPGDSDTSIATTGFVAAALAAVVPATASVAEYRSNSAPTKVLSSGTAWGGVAPVTITDASAVTPDLNTGIDFSWTLGAAGRTINNPTNGKPGQKGVIYLIQDATGGRTITTWGTNWKFAGGTKPVLSAAPNAVDVLSYVVAPGGAVVYAFFSAGMA